jgi:hypothetical protein
MFLGIILGAGAILVLWVLYKAVIYATPLALGICLAMQSYSFGSGSLAAAALGLASAFGSFLLLRFIALRTTSTKIRYALAAAFAMPTVVLAYGIAIDLMIENLPAPLWTQTIAMGFATLAGIISFRRLLEFEADLQ